MNCIQANIYIIGYGGSWGSRHTLNALIEDITPEKRQRLIEQGSAVGEVASHYNNGRRHKSNRGYTGIYIQSSVGGVLVDAGPSIDADLAKLRSTYKKTPHHLKLEELDAIFMTHAIHYDHSHGLCSLKPFLQGLNEERKKEQKPKPRIVASRATFNKLRFAKFLYANANNGCGLLKKQVITSGASFSMCGARWATFENPHGPDVKTNCLISGNFGYLTDVSEVGTPTIDALKGIEILILGTGETRPEKIPNPNRSHILWKDMLNLVGEIKPKHVILTHLGEAWTDEDYEKQLKGVKIPGVKSISIPKRSQRIPVVLESAGR